MVWEVKYLPDIFYSPWFYIERCRRCQGGPQIPQSKGKVPVVETQPDDLTNRRT